MLNEMFIKQKEMIKLLESDIYSQEYLNTMVIACIDELMEFIRETPWKPWKKNQNFNLIKAQEELIDLWHFVINLSIALNLNPDLLYTKFMDKNKTNIKRQKNGY